MERLSDCITKRSWLKQVQNIGMWRGCPPHDLYTGRNLRNYEHRCICFGFNRHVFDILSDKMTGGKLLVFAHHRNVLDALEQGALKSGHIEYIRIDGRTKVSMRCFFSQLQRRGGRLEAESAPSWVPSPLCAKSIRQLYKIAFMTSVPLRLERCGERFQ